MKRFLLLLPLLLFAVPAQADPLSVTLPECSAARHDAYRIQGPDGVWYPTWHPTIDSLSDVRIVWITNERVVSDLASDDR